LINKLSFKPDEISHPLKHAFKSILQLVLAFLLNKIGYIENSLK